MTSEYLEYDTTTFYAAFIVFFLKFGHLNVIIWQELHKDSSTHSVVLSAENITAYRFGMTRR